MLMPAVEIIEESKCYARMPNSKKRPWMKFIIVRTLSVIFTGVLAMAVPKFGMFLNLTGAIAGTTLAFIIPCTMYLILYKDEISKLSRIMHQLIIVVGVILGIISFIISLY